jgi:hypothetical protein
VVVVCTYHMSIRAAIARYGCESVPLRERIIERLSAT